MAAPAVRSPGRSRPTRPVDRPDSRGSRGATAASTPCGTNCPAPRRT